MSVDEVYQYSGVDPWFLVQIKDIVDTEDSLKTVELAGYRSCADVWPQAQGLF